MLEARVRDRTTQLPPRVTQSLAAAFREAREQRWSAVLGGVDLSAEVSPVVQKELGGLLAARLQGRHLERAVAVLSASAGLAGGQAQPAGQEPAEAGSSPAAGITFMPQRDASAPPAGPDPSSFNPAWVSDLVDFAVAQEQQATAARAARPRPQAGPAQDEPAPARVPPSLRMPIGRLIPGLMEELSIHWLLFLGAFLVLAGGLVLTVSRWSHTSEVGRYLPLLVTTLFFQGLAWGVQEWLGLHRSARALAMITVLFLPLNSLAMAWLGLFGSPGGITLGLSSLALLAAVGVSANRRSLTTAEAGAQAPSTLDLSARLVSTCGLAAVWPLQGVIHPVLATAAGLALAAIGLAPGLARASKRESGLDGGSLWFSTVAFGAAYLALIIRMTEAPAQFGLLLFGLVHLLSVASAGLAARPRPADSEIAVSAFLGAFSRFGSLVATLGVLSGGLTDNGWLVVGLLCLSYIRGRAFAQAGAERHLIESVTAAVVAETLFVYADTGFHNWWHSGLKAAFGPSFPANVIPQLLVGLACTMAALSPIAGRYQALGGCLHALGAATTAVLSMVLVWCGGWGAGLALALSLLHAGLAVLFGFAYLAVLSVWLLVMTWAAGLVLLGASGQTWILSGIALTWAVAAAGWASVDERLSRMNPLMMPGVSLSGSVMPLAGLVWIAAILAALAPGPVDPMRTLQTLGSMALLALFFGMQALRDQDERAAFASLLTLPVVYAHLRVQGILPVSVISQLLAVVASYPLLLLSGSLDGRWRVYRPALRLAGLGLPALAAGAGAFLKDALSQSILMTAAGIFYTLLPSTGEPRSWYYVAGGLYNLANILFWQQFHLSTAYVWTLPAGFTLLAFTHVNREQIPADTRQMMRLAGSFLISGEALQGVLASASPFDSAVLAIMATVGVLASLQFRVKAYLMYSTVMLVLDVGAFVLRQVLAFSDVGVGMLLAGGLVLIAVAAAFEQGRATFVRRVEEFRQRFESWD
jgi:hypothetical protein